MSYILISALALVLCAVILWRTNHIARQQSIITQSLIELNNLSDKGEQNSMKAIVQLCETLNKSFTVGAEYMNRSSFALANIAVCMIPFIDSIRESAIDEEDYEKAAECIHILENLKAIVKINE